MREIQHQFSSLNQPGNWIQVIWNLSRQALFETHPQAQEYKDALLKKVNFVPTTKMIDEEKQGRPKGKLRIYQLFRQLGVPEAILDKYYYGVSDKNPFYSNFEEGIIFLPPPLLDSFKSSNAQDLIKASTALGYHIIEGDLRTMAFNVNPYGFGYESEFLFRDQMKANFEPFSHELEKQLRGKDRVRFRRSKSKIAHFFTREEMREKEARFVAVGAQILYLLSDQSLMCAESLLGRNFDAGTVNSLAAPTKKRLRDLLQSELGLKPNVTTTDIPDQNQRNAEEIHTILDLEGEEVFTAYIQSKIARLCLDCEDPRLDPFQYGLVIDPNLWLHLSHS